MTKKSEFGGTTGVVAFTLAEVLITLAIIGVVAALTIPTLIVNYQQRGWNTAATVFERKLEESLKIMNTQGTLAGYKTTEEFVAELQKHLKITKVCKNDDLQSCFEDTVMFGAGEAEPEEVEISKIKTAKNFGQDDWDTNVVGLQLNNGTNALIAYNPKCKQDPYSNQITGTSCVAILYDTSGYSKPNTSGKDLRAINVSSLGTTCAFEIGGTCYGAPFTPTSISKEECLELLGENRCYYPHDYWAGAVKQCGGIQNMPTQAQLDELAQYIYPSITISASSTVYCPKDASGNYTTCRDDAKVSSLGFTNFTSSTAITLWASHGALEMASGYTFYPDYPTRTTIYRYNSKPQAICIIN